MKEKMFAFVVTNKEIGGDIAAYVGENKTAVSNMAETFFSVYGDKIYEVFDFDINDNDKTSVGYILLDENNIPVKIIHNGEDEPEEKCWICNYCKI